MTRRKNTECGGCTKCCEDFALDRDQVNEASESNPGLIQVIRPLGKAFLVRCRQVQPGVGCGIHPGKRGVDRRPSFCGFVDSRRCRRWDR